MKRRKKSEPSGSRLRSVERRLQLLQKRYEAVMGAINENVYDLDILRNRVFYSESMERALGLPPDVLKTADDWVDRIHADDLGRYKAALVAHYKGETERFTCDYRYRAPGGAWRWARQRGIASRDKAGRAVRMIGSTGDVTELKEAELALRRARDEAQEALEQQIAAADILSAISGSPGDTQPVFEAIVQSGLRLFPDAVVIVRLPEGDNVRIAAIAARDPRDVERWRSRGPVPLTRAYVNGVALLDRCMVDVPDGESFPDPSMAPGIRNFLSSGYRAVTIMPMIRGDTAIGTVGVVRRRPGPLTDRQISLLRTFAHQAVIAIESVRLFNETRQALEQQTATAEILQITASSPGDVQPVLDAIARNAVRLCGGARCTVFQYDGRLQYFTAHYGMDAEIVGILRRRYPSPPDAQRVSGRALLNREVIHVADAPADPRFPKTAEIFERGGNRAVLAVPMLKGGQPIGVIFVIRSEPRLFTEQQVALLKTFADEAVIAIENVRLFNETREALEQQTATSAVLQVMSASTTDVQPVFDAIVSNVQRLFGTRFAVLQLVRDDQLELAAFDGQSGFEKIAAEFPQPLSGESIAARAIRARGTVQLAPIIGNRDAAERSQRMAQVLGYNALIATPMVRADEVIGAIVTGHQDGRPFGDKQAALLRAFADQAVIAIEGVRLFNETREALEQQRASGEVLQAISGSISDTAPVFDKILESCERLFTGRIVGLNLLKSDGMLHIGAYHGAHREEFERIFPLPPTVESGSGLSLVERRVVHYPDAQRGAEVPARTRQGCSTIGIKSVIFAPVLWEGRGLGAIFVGRDYESSFSEREIALLRGFADQAAIAIENVRLFTEIQEKSRQLEIASRHKSEFLASMSHELRTPLNAIIGFTRIVMRESGGKLEPLQRDNLEKIHASGQHLLTLINSILDLAKIEAGRVEVHPTQVGLAPVLEQCLRTIEPLVRPDTVSLVKAFNGALPAIYTDEEKLRQIVLNLLSNAAKFTERGTISLSAAAANGSVDIAVTDTGIGIPPEKLELIFEEFEQAHAGAARAQGGTGLGLAIARRLARLLGGDVHARSVRGGGSTFTLTLPVRYSA